MNIILCVSDTFRRDHLGCYGNKRIITPNLDRFSKDCTKFDNCYATSFPTVPCRADLFTGRYTFTYLGWNPLINEKNILADILRKEGFTTLAAVDTPFLIRDGYGYDRGFKDFIYISGQNWSYDNSRVTSTRRYEEDYFAPKTITAAERLMEYYYKEKFFMYIDIWDPHELWDPPQWYVNLYNSNYDGDESRRVWPCYWKWKEYGLTEDDINLAHDFYCGEITMVDRWIGKLLDKVKYLGIWEDTVFIFISDHGFYFGEHGYFGKMMFDWRNCYDKNKKFGGVGKLLGPEAPDIEVYYSPLYSEIVKVPLLIYVPGIKPSETDNLVSTVDIMPTILELAGIKPPDSVQGKSLNPLLKDNTKIIRDFVVTSNPLSVIGQETRVVDDKVKIIKESLPATITDKNWSLIYADDSSPVELYDLIKDPHQLKNIFKKNKEVAKDLLKKYIKLLNDVGTNKNLMEKRTELPSS